MRISCDGTKIWTAFVEECCFCSRLRFGSRREMPLQIGLLKNTTMAKSRIATMTSKSKLSNNTSNGPVGQPIPRVEGPAKVAGLIKYTADVDRPDVLWGKVLRSLCHTRVF